MCFAHALHVRRQNLVPLSCLYTKPFVLVKYFVFHYCTTLHCYKINLYKFVFWGSHFEYIEDAFVMFVSLIFLHPYKILISLRYTFKL